MPNCGINSSTLGVCEKDVDENTEYCSYNEKTKNCNKKDKRKYSVIYDEIKSRRTVIKRKTPELPRESIAEMPLVSIPEIPRESTPRVAKLEVEPRVEALERMHKMPIRVYKLEDDFNLAKMDVKAKQGAYGAALKANFKSTGQPVILKNYLAYKKTDVINTDIIKEITLLQFLNQFQETKCVSFYGIAFSKDKNHMFLVLEALEKDLRAVSKQTLTPEQYKIIFYQILKAFNAIHIAGVVHNDIKLPNIMIKGEQIRIIDFGLAEYIGMGPTRELVSDYICTEVTKAPDASDQSVFGYLPTNRKTYATDIYSIGATYIHLILKNYYKLKVKPDGIYEAGRQNLSPKISKIIGPEGLDLLMKIMNPDTHLRWCAKEALGHPYFSGLPDFVPIDRSIVGGGVDVFYNKTVQYNEDEYFKHQMELCYLEEQHQTFMNDKIPMKDITTNKNLAKYHYILIDWIMQVFTTRDLILGIDLLINSFQVINQNIEKINNKYSYSKLQLLSLTSVHLESAVFRFIDNDIKSYLHISGNVYDYETFAQFFRDDILLDNNARIDLYPISVHIQYIFLKLQFELKDPRINVALKKLYIGMCLHLTFWYIQPKPFAGDATIWEVAVLGAIQTLSKILEIPAIELNRKPMVSFLALEESKFNSMVEYVKESMENPIYKAVLENKKTSINEIVKDFYQNSEYF